jgi:hypothetical protein
MTFVNKIKHGQPILHGMDLAQRSTPNGPRWFASTNDGFDGTAQGYGYKSAQAAHKAYWFFKNKGRLRTEEREAKKFLRQNPAIEKMLADFFDPDKEGLEISVKTMVESMQPGPLQEQLLNNKQLWKAIEKVLCG